jgi:hypothetical protein
VVVTVTSFVLVHRTVGNGRRWRRLLHRHRSCTRHPRDERWKRGYRSCIRQPTCEARTKLRGRQPVNHVMSTCAVNLLYQAQGTRCKYGLTTPANLHTLGISTMGSERNKKDWVRNVRGCHQTWARIRSQGLLDFVWIKRSPRVNLSTVERRDIFDINL